MDKARRKIYSYIDRDRERDRDRPIYVDLMSVCRQIETYTIDINYGLGSVTEVRTVAATCVFFLVLHVRIL